MGYNRYLFVSTFDLSGELSVYPLLKKLKEKKPEIIIKGISLHGILKEDGLLTQILNYNIPSLNGITDVIPYLPKLTYMFFKLTEYIKKDPPRISILVDTPEINLRLLKLLKEVGSFIIYFIPPQIWVWRKSRIELIKRYVDVVIVLFPWEEMLLSSIIRGKVYRISPVLMLREEEVNKYNSSIIGVRDYVVLMPGSRLNQFRRHLNLLLNTAKLLNTHYNGLKIVLPYIHREVTSVLKGIPFLNEEISVIFHYNKIIEGIPQSWHLLKWSIAGILAFGSATLEAGLLGTPFISFYKTDPFTFFIARRLIKIPYLALPNIILGRRVIPEFIQDEASPKVLMGMISSILNNYPYYKSIAEEVSQILKEKLYSVFTYEEFANITVSVINKK